MANIKGYEAPSGIGLSPTETGIEAFAGAARRMGAYGNQIADAKNQEGRQIASSITDVGSVVTTYVDQKDRSDISAAATGTLAKLDRDWALLTKGNGLDKNDPNYVPPADPRDPTIAAKFMEENVGPALDKLNGIAIGENGNKFAESKIEQIRDHLSQKVTADMSTMAGQAAILQDRQTTNNLSNLVTTSPDFHSVDMALQMHKEAAAGAKSNPNISGVQAGQLDEHFQLSQEQIVHAAAASAISKAKDPVATADAFSRRYPDYIKGDAVNQLAKAAQTQTKANLYYDKQVEVLQKQQAVQAVHAASAKTINDNVSVDPQTNEVTVKPKFFKDALDIARNNPDAPNAAETVRTMIGWGQAQQSKERVIVDNPAVVTDFSNRLFDPNKPLTEMDLMRASTKGDISNQTYTKFKGMISDLEQTPLKGPVYQTTMKAAHSALVLSGVGIPGKDDKGEQNYALFVQHFIPQYLAASRAGTLPPNALDVKDPNSMISQAMEPFKRTVQQRIQDYTASLGGTPATPTRKVGDVSVPAALGGVASLQYNPTTKQWRDQTSGTIYDSTGQPVAK